MRVKLRRLFFGLILIVSGMHSLSQTQKINVIAYFSGRPSQLDSFDAKKITHIIFSFGHLQGNNFHLRSAIDTAVIQKMVALKSINPDLKVMLSLGGWGGCETCSDVFATKKGRKKFARSVKEILSYFNADGIDIDWEYPSVAGYAGHKYTPKDKGNFTELIARLRKKLGRTKVITFAAGVSKRILETGIDWPGVMKYVDWVNLMTYDLVGAGSTTTGHHTLLFSTTNQTVSTDYTVNYLNKVGVPSNKLVVGGAFYGKIFSNVADTANGLYQPATFQTTIPYKFLSLQLTPQNGYNYYWDDTAKASYLYNPAQRLYVTYDDKRTLQVKTRYAIDKKLNGIMFWQLGQDAFEDGLLNAIDSAKNSMSDTNSNLQK